MVALDLGETPFSSGLGIAEVGTLDPKLGLGGGLVASPDDTLA